MAAPNSPASTQCLDMSEAVQALTLAESPEKDRSRLYWLDKPVRIMMVIVIVIVLVGAVASVGLLIAQSIWPPSVQYTSACNTTVSKYGTCSDLF